MKQAVVTLFFDLLGLFSMVGNRQKARGFKKKHSLSFDRHCWPLVLF